MLDSTNGKAATTKICETLQKVLVSANKVLSDKNVIDAKKYQDVLTPLAAPVKSVNDTEAVKAAQT